MPVTKVLIVDDDRTLGSAKPVEAAKKQTSIGIVQVATDGVNAALAGKSGVSVYKDYRGIDVVGAYAPFMVLGLKWGILAKQDAEGVYRPIAALPSDLLHRSVIVALAIVANILLLSVLFIHSVRTLLWETCELTGVRKGDEFINA